MDPLAAFTAGMLVLVSMSINASLAQKWGVFRAGAANYAVGLIGATVLAFGVPAQEAGPAPWWAWTGGFLGVAIVSLSNWAVPRVPATQVAVLLFLGQATMSLVLETLSTGSLPGLKITGLALASLGLVWQTRLGREGRSRSRT